MGAQDQRPRFYEGQYLSADDLAAVVDYARVTNARHALGAHTWGIASGLELHEVPAAGKRGRVEVILQPGIAWDGFGRAIVVTRPQRLMEKSLSERFPFATTAGGNAMLVCIAYNEVRGGAPAPGFESCIDGDQNARAQEGFQLVFDMRSYKPDDLPRVTIGDRTLDAMDTRSAFDAAAPRLWDSSVPHQTFPDPEGKPQPWLIPLGYARWTSAGSSAGYFQKADDAILNASLAHRRHAGVVAERIEAAAGALVMHRRGEDPGAPHRYSKIQELAIAGVASGAISAAEIQELRQDLLWVEGDVRVGGNAKINGGRLHFRNADGLDEGTPLYMKREADGDPRHAAARHLRVVIGSDAQIDNRFIISPPSSTHGARSFLVVSGSVNPTECRAGVNVADPDAALDVKGDWSAVAKDNKGGAMALRGEQPTIRFEGSASAWLTQATTSSDFRVAHKAGNEWKSLIYATLSDRVGIGSEMPSTPLAVRSERQSASREHLLSFEDFENKDKWRISLDVNGGKHLNIHESDQKSESRLFLKSGGNVGIGTSDPVRRLQVNGGLVLEKVENPGKLATPSLPTDATMIWNDGTWLWLNQDHEITSPPRLGKGGVRTMGLLAPGSLSVAGIGGYADPGYGNAWIEKRMSVATTELTARVTIKGQGLNNAANPEQGNLRIFPDSLDADISYDGGSDGIFVFKNTSTTTNKATAFMGANFGIGTTNPQAGLHVIGQTQIDGNLSVGDTQNAIGGALTTVSLVVSHSMTLSGDGFIKAGTFWKTSDASLKTDIHTLSQPLETMLGLRGVTFSWKASVGREKRIGFIAQEVEQVLPNWVKPTPDGHKAISLEGFEALTVESMRTLKSEIDALKAKVRVLEEQLGALPGSPLRH